MLRNIINKLIGHVVFQNMAALSVVKIAEYLFPLLTIPFISRKLGIDNFGLLMFILSIHSLALIITDYGFGVSATYKISKNKENKSFLNDYISAIFSIKLILCIISISLILFYFLLFFEKYNVNKTTVLFLCFLILLQAYQTQWFFQGIEKMKFITFADVLSKMSYAIFVFIFVSITANVEMVLLAALVSNLISTTVYLILMHRVGIRLERPKIRTIVKELKASFGFFLSRIAVSLSSTANNFVIGNFTTARDCANFGAAEKLYSAGMGLFTPLNNALYPYLARTKDLKLLYKTTTILFILSLIGVTILSFFSEDIIRIVFGADYLEAKNLFRLFLILIPINVVSILFGYPAFAILGDLKYPNLTAIISGLGYIFALLFLYLTQSISKENVLYAVIVTDSITLACRLAFFFIKKQNNDR